jgi:ParB/RepB/Spo0J family partition protein
MAKDKLGNRERPTYTTPVEPTKFLQVIKIPLELLEDNPYQPRLSINEDSLQEFMASIEKDGLQSPIKTTKIGGFSSPKYTVVFGHRRTEAFRRLAQINPTKYNEIDAFYEPDISKNELRRLSLIENVQREDLNIIELAISFDNAINDGTFISQKALAEALGFTTTKVSECLSLLKLQEKITKDLEDDRRVKDVTALAALNKVQNNHTQWDLYKRFRDGELDRKGLIQIIQAEISGSPKSNSQCEFSLNKSKFSMMFKPNKDLTKKGKYAEYERFAKEKLENLQKELQEKERELLK